MTHGLAIGTSKMDCKYCLGTGARRVRYGRNAVCKCSYRAVFRACYNRYIECGELGSHASTVSLEFAQGPKGRCTYSRKREEFRADFYLVARRYLPELELQIFNFHFLLGADWRLCCRKLQMTRGTFFHALYRTEQLLGKAYCEVEPYPLYPMDEYFGGTTSKFTGPVPFSNLAESRHQSPKSSFPLPCNFCGVYGSHRCRLELLNAAS